MKPLAVSLAAAMSIVVFAAPSHAEPLNLYEWAAPAPIVVEARVYGSGGKFSEIIVTRSFRGPYEPGTQVWVYLRRANADRYSGEDRVVLESDRHYLFLLEEAAPQRPGRPPSLDLVRGVLGVREIPAEGAPAVLDALDRFVRIQDAKDETAKWDAFRTMIEDAANPVEVETALRMHLKFRRGEPVVVHAARPLVDHPAPTLRELAIDLLGLVVSRNDPEAVPDSDGLRRDLIAHARRDGVIAVRAAATRALAGFTDRSTRLVLEEIASEDPEQAVRYEAEKIIWSRSVAGDGGTGRD